MIPIILFSISFFLLFGFLAWFSSKLKAWRHVELVTLPLAVVGVLLAYEASGLERRLAILKSEVAQKQLDINEITQKRPGTNETPFISNRLLEGAFSVLQAHGELGAACEKVISSSPSCIVAVDAREPIDVAEREVSSIFNSDLDNEVKLLRYCEVFPKLLENLEKSGALTSSLAQAAAKHYKTGTELRLNTYEFEVAARFVSQFESVQKVEIDKIYKALGPEYEALKPFAYERIGLARVILYGFEGCFRAPASVRDGTIGKWYDQYRNAKTEAEKIAAELNDIRSKKDDIGSSTTEIFMLAYWPFIVVFALSLQFGKVVSQLHHEINSD